eukprot:scpid25286/ scgid12980/ 
MGWERCEDTIQGPATRTVHHDGNSSVSTLDFEDELASSTAAETLSRRPDYPTHTRTSPVYGAECSDSSCLHEDGRHLTSRTLVHTVLLRFVDNGALSLFATVQHFDMCTYNQSLERVKEWEQRGRRTSFQRGVVSRTRRCFVDWPLLIGGFHSC